MSSSPCAIGNIYGHLTVIQGPIRKRIQHSIGVTRTVKKWLCQCECGKKTLVSQSSLSGGLTKSCGCLRFKPGTRRSSRRQRRMSV